MIDATVEGTQSMDAVISSSSLTLREGFVVVIVPAKAV
jgi:hypothetical protein